MADDVWTALVKGVLGFAHSRAGSLVGDSFNDTGSFVSALEKDPTLNQQLTKDAFDKLKKDITDLTDIGKAVADALKPQFDKAKAAITAMAADLSANPFTMADALKAVTELAKVLQALDAAMDIMAKKVGEKSADPVNVEKAIKGIKEPWQKPFRNLAGGATQVFDAVCHAVLGVDSAGAKLDKLLVWDDAKKTLSAEIVAAGPQSPVPAIQFDGAKVTAFFSFQTDVRLGVTVSTKLKAGMRGDKLLQKIIPGEPPTADSESTAITLDTTNGITFGGANKRITLPVRFSFPGVELRELAIGLPDDKDEAKKGKVDVTMTIAAKIGDVLGVVAEGAGVTITIPQGATPFGVVPRLPDGVGMRVSASVIKGGGYLRRKGTEFGGVLDLQFTKIGITAIGLLNTDPFSMVIVIGVRFAPKIDLGFGFTLNGLGGILAIERRLDSNALRAGIHDGTADTLLFPDDPIAAAPKILTKLASIFPAQPGGFVVGPIAQLGWGSQAGFVKAKLGVVLCLPDPKIVLLGAIEIAVPSTEVPDGVKIVQLHAEIYGEFTPEYLLLIVSLNNSKVVGISISGDIGLFIRWAGEAAFALSVGGFFPKYKPPAELSDLHRIAIDMSAADIVKIHAEGYFAVTSNSIQFGGMVRLSADVSVASAKAWLSLDALFQWAPRFYFIVILDVGIEVKVMGVTLCGVSFHGELQGTTPWRLEGSATVSVLWWDIDVDIGPIQWGDEDTSIAPTVSPLDIAAQALNSDDAWTTLMPAGTDTLARFTAAQSVDEAKAAKLLVHPLGALEARQQKVPFEQDLDRIGSASVSSRRINLTDPKFNGIAAGAVANAYDFFPPGHFLKLTEDQQATRPDFERFASGMQVTASRVPVYGTDDEAVGVPYDWDTVFPNENFGKNTIKLKFPNLSRHAFRTNGVARASRLRGNPYAPPSNPMAATAAATGGLALNDFGQVTIRRREDATAPAGYTQVFTTTEASRRLDQFGADAEDSLVLVGAGVEP